VVVKKTRVRNIGKDEIMSDQQFPVDKGQAVPKGQQSIGRRRFLETGAWSAAGVIGLTLFGTGAGFVVGDSLQEKDAQWINVGEVASLAAGQMHQSTYTMRSKDAWRTVEKKGLLYAFSEDGANYTVLSAICTHLGCNVHWEAESGDFSCPCHDAHFSQAGEVISGPPRRALARLEAKIEAGNLMVLV
jgi:Rieske Fe-S protein